MKTRPADVPPGGAADSLASSDRRKKKPKGRTKEETENLDKNTLYGIVSSAKDSARLTLKLTRMKSPDGDEDGDLPSQAHVASDPEAEPLNPANQFSRNAQVVSNEPGADEPESCEQTPVCSNTKDSEDGEADAMADAERIERESAGDKERWSKEVQDKGIVSALHLTDTHLGLQKLVIYKTLSFTVPTDKPLKKRKQDSYPQECGTEESDWLNVQGGNADSSLTPKKMNAASNGGSRPALMVSIDLQKAGRLIGQPAGVTASSDHRHHVNSKAEGHADEAAAANRPEIIKQHTENAKRSGSSRPADAPKQSQERWRESKQGDGKTENNRGHSDDRCSDATRQKHDKHSDSHHREDTNHEHSHSGQPEAQKPTSKPEPHVKHGEDKSRDRNRDRDKDRDVDVNMEDARGRCKNRQSNKDRDRENTKGEDRDKVRNKKKDRETDRDRQKDRDEAKDRNKDRDKNKDRDESRDGNKVRDKNKDRDVDKEGDESRDRHKDRDRNKDAGVGANKNKERDKNKDRDGGPNKNKELSKDKNKDRGESKERNKEKERNKAKAKDEDSERDVGKSRTKDRERDAMRSEDRAQARPGDKNRDRERTREKDKDRRQHSSQENCSRPPPEQQGKPESAADKHARIRKTGDPKGHQASENPNVPSAQNRQERRSGDGCRAGSRQQPAEAKLGQFPPFLFGGSSGSLKNFVIPKLTRSSRDAQTSDKLKEPLVRLKRVSLIENLNRRAKPVVVLQRLSADEVRQIIRDGRDAQSSRCSFSKPDRGGVHAHFPGRLSAWAGHI